MLINYLFKIVSFQTDININDWSIPGSQLCSMTHEEFRKKLPKDPGNIFWTHLQLLKECKFVSVVHKAAENELKIDQKAIVQDPTAVNLPPLTREPKIMRKTFHNLKREGE